MNLRKSYIVLALSSSLVLSSCEVNDLVPQTALSETTAFQTPERIALAVAGVYDGGQSGFYASGAVRGYVFGSAHIEQGDMRGEDMALAATFYAATYQNNYNATSANNVYYWQNAYAMINRANIVIAGLKTAQPSSTLTQAQIDAYEGECRLLRAMAHHYLLVNFARPFSDNPTAAGGGIPYREVAVTGGNSVDEAIKQGRNTVAECYDKIIADLNYAESTLPDTRSGNLKITRATKGAAIALKTRVRLHQNNWAEVIKEANKLVPIASPFSSPIGAYALTSTALGPFGSNNKSNSESIFSIENNDVDNSGTNGAMAAMYSAVGTNGRGIVLISPVLWNQPFFPADDLRKSATAIAKDAAGSAGKGGNFSRKYPDVTARSENAPIIRYAEVLLNLAEAIARTNTSVDSRALALLSAVRNRSVPTPANQYTTASFTTNKDLVRAIINERRPEFVAEGLRWLDIHRLAQDSDFKQADGIPAKANISISNFAPLYTNDPKTTISLQPGLPYSDFRFVWPIPLEELNNNPTLAKQQNPGY
ncbi:RagB/SusD family nutrient uptake outer membrane protein [Spirosoma daeguense]